MKALKYNLASIVATGVIVVTLLSLGLFWARWLCRVNRDDLVTPTARKATIDLSLLLDPAGKAVDARAQERRAFLASLETMLKGDPNEEQVLALWKTRMKDDRRAAEVAPRIEANVSRMNPPLVGLGLLQYLETRMPGLPGSQIYRWDPIGLDATRHYYDPALGQIVLEARMAGERDTTQYSTEYAGPEGIAATPDEKLGRFLTPISDGIVMDPQIVYDSGVRRFFAVNWGDRTVRKGPELPADGTHEPIQAGVLGRNWWCVSMNHYPVGQTEGGPSVEPIGLRMHGDRVLVLDASGRIDLLDTRTLDFVGVAGMLNAPTPVSGSVRKVRPEDLTAYEAYQITTPRPDGTKERDYRGCVVAALGREGVGLQLDVYDPNGHRVASAQNCAPQYTGEASTRSIPAAQAAYWSLPGAQTLSVLQFTLESLHPPVFLLASYLAAPHMDAEAGYRSAFLLPDSFLAMKARDTSVGPVERPFGAILIALPALLLSLVLAWLVNHDGVKLGSSQNTRLAWTIAMVFFGLPGYFTYRLTRPRATLVTCPNCGKGRRPDLEKCQRCGSPWVVPELVVPAWRVLGEPESAQENASSREPQADSQVQREC